MAVPELFPFCNDLVVASFCALGVFAFIAGLVTYYLWWRWHNIRRSEGRRKVKEQVRDLVYSHRSCKPRRWSTGSSLDFEVKNAYHVEYPSRGQRRGGDIEAGTLYSLPQDST
jgi:hypothetical protein